MDYQMKQLQRQSQGMVIMPQIIEAISLLQLPIMELCEIIEEKITENPVLEFDDKERNEVGEAKNEIDWEKILDLQETPGRDYFYPLEEFPNKKENFILERKSTLHEHLHSQLVLLNLDEEDSQVAEFIISSIDEDGYLRESLDELAGILNIDKEKLENIVGLIQSLNPPGIGARSLEECLLLQLKAGGKLNSLAILIIKEALGDLARKRYDLIARKTGIPLIKVKEEVEFIASLNPKPGRGFAGKEKPLYIVPDIIISKNGDSYEIELNERELPRLRISQSYKNLLRDKNTPPETKKFVHEKMNQALWLIRGVNRRQETIKKVAHCIVEVQKEFLEKGIHFLKPLSLEEVANLIGVHPSTVSRIVSGKYIQTPRGLFELKVFFSPPFKSKDNNKANDDSKVIATKNLKEMIKKLIETEDCNRPLSDEDIVKVLQKEEIFIARRTVAKYRTQFNILPSYLRKK